MNTQTPLCRLCGAETATAFSATVLDQHRIRYFRCAGCRSLQTEQPYWLQQAYDGHLGHLDLGAVQRNLSNQAVCWLVSRLWGLRDALDYGGGDGLLCRMLRDHGVNCFVWDKYGVPVYAQTFTEPDFAQPQIVFSFEVFEHFVDPATDLAEVFERGATLILASTGLYAGQGADWFYLSLPSGRHVFFYSPEAMSLIARRFGYVATISGPYILFTRPEASARARLAVFRLMTSAIGVRLMRAFMALKPARGVAADSERMRRIGTRKPGSTVATAAAAEREAAPAI